MKLVGNFRRAPRRASDDVTGPFRISQLMQIWQMGRCSAALQDCMIEALSCYAPHTLTALVCDALSGRPRLQVAIMENTAPETAWAYFPIRKGQVGDKHLNIQLQAFVRMKRVRPYDSTEVLLLLGGRRKPGESHKECFGQFLHHFGHTLLYLRSPRMWNECDDAKRENCILCGWPIPKELQAQQAKRRRRMK